MLLFLILHCTFPVQRKICDESCGSLCVIGTHNLRGVIRPYNSLTSFSAGVGSLHQHKAGKDGDKKREKKLQNENKNEERKHLKKTIKRVPECLSSPPSPEIKKSTMLTPLLPSNPHAAGGPPPQRGNFKGKYFSLRCTFEISRSTVLADRRGVSQTRGRRRGHTP